MYGLAMMMSISTRNTSKNIDKIFVTLYVPKQYLSISICKKETDVLRYVLIFRQKYETTKFRNGILWISRLRSYYRRHALTTIASTVFPLMKFKIDYKEEK